MEAKIAGTWTTVKSFMSGNIDAESEVELDHGTIPAVESMRK